jgi:periplasmic divalent cation tolerance protein
VSIVPGIRSIYRWKGEIHDDRELLLIAKTSVKNLNKIEKTIRKLHTYEVPEIVSVRMDRGSEHYLRWLKTETTRTGRK